MSASNPLLTYWYFHLPNFVLAALMYTLFGRIILGMVIDRDSKNYIWRFFSQSTDPIVRVVAFITPQAAVPVILWGFAFVWLFWIRIALYALFAVLDLTPRL